MKAQFLIAGILFTGLTVISNARVEAQEKPLPPESNKQVRPYKPHPLLSTSQKENWQAKKEEKREEKKEEIQGDRKEIKDDRKDIQKDDEAMKKLRGDLQSAEKTLMEDKKNGANAEKLKEDEKRLALLREKMKAVKMKRIEDIRELHQDKKELNRDLLNRNAKLPDTRREAMRKDAHPVPDKEHPTVKEEPQAPKPNK